MPLAQSSRPGAPVFITSAPNSPSPFNKDPPMTPPNHNQNASLVLPRKSLTGQPIPTPSSLVKIGGHPKINFSPAPTVRDRVGLRLSPENLVIGSFVSVAERNTVKPSGEDCPSEKRDSIIDPSYPSLPSYLKMPKSLKDGQKYSPKGLMLKVDDDEADKEGEDEEMLKTAAEKPEGDTPQTHLRPRLGARAITDSMELSKNRLGAGQVSIAKKESSGLGQN